MISVRLYRTLGVVCVASALVFSACSSSGEHVRAASVRPGKDRKKAPEFSLKDSDGKNLSLADYKGKVVLLNFWATWCGPCRVEIPWFVEFEQKYKDHGFAVIGVSMDDDGWKAVKPYIAEKHMNYRIVVGDDAVGSLYGGVDNLPTTFLIDREGNIAATHVGLVSKNDYQNEILQLLDGKKAENRAGGQLLAVAGAK